MVVQHACSGVKRPPQPTTPVHPLHDTRHVDPQGCVGGVRQVRAALGLWDGSGAFVFTSSTGVYAEDGGPCSEDGPLLAQGHSDRADRRARGSEASLITNVCLFYLY